MNPKKILLVDDTQENLMLLSDILRKNGYKVSTAISGNAALRYLNKNTPDIILLDIKMPEMDGFELCRQIKKIDEINQVPIIFISALNEMLDKVTAFQVGGVDYIPKPFQIEEVLARVNTHISIKDMQNELQSAYHNIEIKVQERTTELKEANAELNETNHKLLQEIENRKKIEKELEKLKNQLEDEVFYLQDEIRMTLDFDEIIGNCKAVKQMLELVQQVAPMETAVLILGETGTGKELIARAIHQNSQRKDRPLVKVNCAALPSNLIESELFGHEKGAFTGATSRKSGRFELANHGTIFLDEVGDMPLDLQAKLLRILQEGEFERLGGTSTIKIDVRVLAATNRDLDKLRAEGKFRDDLFFRLNVFPITSPSLREREGDLPVLARHFIDKYNLKAGKNIQKIAQKDIETLENYAWPGNIRELENIIERAVILSNKDKLLLGDWFAQSIRSTENNTSQSMDEMQKKYIVKVLKQTKGRIRGSSGAAKILDMKPTTLESRMKKLSIKIKKSSEIS